MKKIYIYSAYERFWHWMQMFLIFFLMISGFEIHGSFTFFGYENAVNYHNVAAIALLVLIGITIFWHFTTGMWKQYIPSFKNIKSQLDYYLFGIFKNAPHHTNKTLLSKLNPLQRLVYFGLKIILIPMLVISGILYLFYRYPHNGNMEHIHIKGLENIAIIHTVGAFLIIIFLIIHLYLITTGQSVFSNLKAMITGYEEIEEESTDADKKENE